MAELMTWSVDRVDGRYVGQAQAFSPKIAFCQCMCVLGKSINPGDIEFELLKDGTGKLRYEAEEFILTPLRARVPREYSH